MEKCSKIVGIDEAGKGDFFGYLVVAGVIVKEEDLIFLKELNVRDSKKISDNKILYLSNIIKKKIINSIIYISPKKYNELYYKFKNLNKIVAWGHSRVIKNLLNREENIDKILIDKFTTKNYIENFLTEKEKKVERIEIVNGEKEIAIATASILARSGFLITLDKLKKEWKIDFYKGASDNVNNVGVEFVKKYGIENLEKVSKINFRNYKKIVESLNQLNFN